LFASQDRYNFKKQQIGQDMTLKHSLFYPIYFADKKFKRFILSKPLLWDNM